MKVTIKGYNAVAEWKWALPPGCDDTCGICRVVFEGSCSKCKYPGDDCPIGKSTHVFHMHCITDWIRSEASQGRCPMCRQVFREKVAHSKKTSGSGPGPGSGGAGAANSRASSSTSAGTARSR
ncbi:hypothetical protein M409DRAFT_35513 [Zasmidium cellare ATCC 36951]|uniref:Anaphase-promoting complex subunit 11 n=1 Tax=Zasmidium cellare ATCC 36951 TaxID=1080233 RepID=A0A6A6D461_ZASCE|nr:uncharacterized protein M409DRAFT_35513 [Zasmidium cellare ATCC 36951]KAF2173150.1 hypothetical protein M409DRAFT_35513 [Zasmidium cellare ATCC 36951]